MAWRRRGYRRGGGKSALRTWVRRPTAWYRHYGGQLSLTGSVTEFGSLSLIQGQQLLSQSATAPSLVLESNREVTQKRLIMRIAVSLIVGAAAAVKFYFGVWKSKGGGTALAALSYDPRINVGSAAVQAANAQVDWLHLYQCDVEAPAGGPYSLATLMGSGPIVLDIGVSRRLSSDDVIGVSAGFAGLGMAAVNPGTGAVIDFDYQALFAGVGS